MHWFLLGVLLCLVPTCHSHGQLTYPPSNRAGGTYDTAGSCGFPESDEGPYGCLWFSQPAIIPGSPTLNESKYRTYNVHAVPGSPTDWTMKYPWRAPGTAPVQGSGCGIAGGNPVVLWNGGVSPPKVPQGTDGLKLPAKTPTIWAAGSTVEVAFAMAANHGGGYSYRLCNKKGPITEACFQKTVLKFASDKQWLQFSGAFVPHAPRVEIPRTSVTTGVHPPGSEWTRNPIPACNVCNQAICGDPLIKPNYTEASGKFTNPGLAYHNRTFYGGKKWMSYIACAGDCAGAVARGYTGILCPNNAQFPEPYPFASGYFYNSTHPERSVSAFSIVDQVVVPADLPTGEYLLSWRWDCEATSQVWNNCADITVYGK